MLSVIRSPRRARLTSWKIGDPGPPERAHRRVRLVQEARSDDGVRLAGADGERRSWRISEGKCWPSPSTWTARVWPCVAGIEESRLDRAADAEVHGKIDDPDAGEGAGGGRRAVGRAVVHDDDVEIRGFGRDRGQDGADVLFFVESGDDDDFAHTTAAKIIPESPPLLNGRSQLGTDRGRVPLGKRGRKGDFKNLP